MNYNCLMKLNFFIMIFKVTGVSQRLSGGSLSFILEFPPSFLVQYATRNEDAADTTVATPLLLI